MDVNDDTNAIDAATIDASSLPERPTEPGEGFRVVVLPSAWQRLLEHANSTVEVEVGGVLVGNLYRDAAGQPYLLIEASIPALAAESKAANVTFTADSWTHIHEVMDRDHAGRSIVGWYHTHPNFGIFLSEMDVFIQRHFFDLPHQVAIVVDPVAHAHGCFVWRNDVPTQEPMWIESEGKPQPIATPPKPVPMPASAQTQSPRPSRLDREQWYGLAGITVLGFILLASIAFLIFSNPESATTRPV